MPTEYTSNYYFSTLQGNGGTITSSQTTFSVASVTGMPAFPFRLVMGPQNAAPTEIALVTGAASTLLTATRGIEAVPGTGLGVGVGHNDGDQVAAGLTAAGIPNLQQLIGQTGATGNTGATGASGAGFLRFLGAYNAGTSYILGDGVSQSGATYICIAPTTGNAPPNATYWAVAGASLSVANTWTANQSMPVLDKGGEVFNASAYADPTGSVDATTALTALMTSGRHVVIPTGSTFKVTSLALNALTDLWIEGGGLILGSDRTVDPLLITGCTRVKVSDLKVQHATPGARSTNAGIHLGTCTDYEITGCEVSSTSGYGIMVQGSTRGRVHANTVHDTGADGIGHLWETGGTVCTQFVVSNNAVYNTGDDGISVTSTTGAAVPCSDFAIVGNTCRNNKSNGITVAGGADGTISGNTIDAPTFAGITAYTYTGLLAVQNIAIVGNTINLANSYNTPGSAAGSIHVTATSGPTPGIDGVLIADNRIRQSASWFIYAQGSGSAGAIKNLAIKGNHCEGPMLAGTTFDPGIYALGSPDSVTISGNDIWLPNGYGVFVATGCLLAITTNNNIYHPNQGNLGSSYGVQNAATAGAAFGNIVVPDAGKTALTANVSVINPTLITNVAPIASPTFTGVVATTNNTLDDGAANANFTNTVTMLKPVSSGATSGYQFNDRDGTGGDYFVMYANAGTAAIYSSVLNASAFTFNEAGNGTIFGNLSVGQSATAVATATSGTIATANIGVSRVSPAGAVTAVVLAAGTVAGQEVTVVNEAIAANTVTFDIAANSHVADGASTIIPGLAATSFVWDSSTSLWYRIR